MRIVLTLVLFVSFFVTSTVVGVLALPLHLFPTSPGLRRRRTRLLNRGLGGVARLLRGSGLIDYVAPTLPAQLRDRAFLLVANHPSFLDVVILLGAVPELTCVVKASWYRSLLLGPLLRLTDHVPGPGLGGGGGSWAPVLDRIEGALRAGRPVLVFPEGTRSPARDVHRFRRGAFEAAMRAGVPVQPVLVTVEPPFLGKGQRAWQVPKSRPRYRFEWLETIDTTAAAEDSRALARRLAERYRLALRHTEAACASA